MEESITTCLHNRPSRVQDNDVLKAVNAWKDALPLEGLRLEGELQL